MNDTQFSKTQDPFPGCGGRMINIFDLSTAMVGTKPLTDRSHRDGSPPVRRYRPDVKRTTNVSGVNVADELATGKPRSNVSKKAGGTPIPHMKMLIAKEMPKETESKRKPPSVVARLMGLDDDLPSPQPSLKEGHSPQRQKEHGYFNKIMPCQIHLPSKDMVESKDVYEVRQLPPRTDHHRDRPKGRFLEGKNDKGTDLARQKFMEAKRLATDEKLLQSKELQDALEILSSNRDLFLEFLNEPNSIFAKQMSELHSIPPPSHTKRITVLKPLRSVESKGGKQSKLQQVKESRLEINKPRFRCSLPNSKAGSFSQPTRIVVLKPGPGNPDCIKAKACRSSVSAGLIDQNDCYGGMEDNESREIAQVSHEQDESLLASVYSNGYGGDESSFNRSEHEYIEEEGGVFSNLEIAMLTPHHSWDHINRFGSPYSVSSISRASFSPEPLVIREAKKRLSERWALVASNEESREQIQVPRDSSTLGEMLAMHEVKKEEVGESNRQSASASVGRTSDGEKGECSPRNLSRLKSGPVSSSVFENIRLDLQSSSSQDSESIVTTEMVKPKGRSSFRGKVSSFFFSRSKKFGKEKLNCSSVVASDKVQTPNAEVSGNTNVAKSDHNSTPDRVPVENHKETPEISTFPVSCSALETGFVSEVTLSLGRSISADYLSENQDKIRPSESPRTNRDQPSPTSVLDAPFEDFNNGDHQSSRNPQSLSRCSTIESVAHSLSWEDLHSEARTLNPPELPTTSSKVADEELDSYFFVQKLLSSSGLVDNETFKAVFAGWHSVELPLSPMLHDEFLGRKDEAAGCRERSNQMLLFDCVNAALLEIGKTTLRSVYPWTKIHAAQPCTVLAGVWSLVRDWCSGDGKLVEGDADNVSLVVERVVAKEVQGRGWLDSMRLEVDEMSKQIGEQVLEELVGEAFACV